MTTPAIILRLWRSQSVILALLACVILSSNARAIAPEYVPDVELAKRPIIVVAHWDMAKRTRHTRTRKESGQNVVDAWEVHTELVVDRVIKGDLMPGKHPLLIGYAVGWDDKGRRFASYTSTELMGDVDDVSKPNLWLLSRGKSWDAKDTTSYLALDTYRGVQPLSLERYFGILTQQDRDERIADALSSSDQTTVLRALKYIHGDRLPWPYANEFTDFIEDPKKKPKPLVQHATAVGKLIDRSEPEIRQHASAVFSSLAGLESRDRMRALLTDSDAKVRGIAVGALAGLRDGASSAQMAAAATGMSDPWLAYEIVARLSAWKDGAAVPVLIQFLQTDGSAGQIGDDIFCPAAKARRALYSICGYRFPYRVAESQKAWAVTAGLKDARQRRAKLTALLGPDMDPFIAYVVNHSGGNAVRIVNRSKEIQYLSKAPQSIDYSSDHISSGKFFNEKEPRYLQVPPGGSVRIPIAFERYFLMSSPRMRKVSVHYTRNGNDRGVNAWVGTLQAVFGPGWTEPPRTYKQVVIKWPNGRVRGKGPTLNRARHGEWTFYDRHGRKVKSIDYFDGSEGDTAYYNPNYSGGR